MQFETIYEYAAMNVLVHVFGEQMFAFLLGMFQGVELLG